MLSSNENSLQIINLGTLISNGNERIIYILGLAIH